jgi:hypothetical protein
LLGKKKGKNMPGEFEERFVPEGVREGAEKEKQESEGKFESLVKKGKVTVGTFISWGSEFIVTKIEGDKITLKSLDDIGLDDKDLEEASTYSISELEEEYGKGSMEIVPESEMKVSIKDKIKNLKEEIAPMKEELMIKESQLAFLESIAQSKGIKVKK